MIFSNSGVSADDWKHFGARIPLQSCFWLPTIAAAVFGFFYGHRIGSDRQQLLQQLLQQLQQRRRRRRRSSSSSFRRRRIFSPSVFFQPIQIERKKEKHPLFPEIVPMKVSLRFTFDIIIQVFFSRQFSSLRFSLPGGLPGPGGENESETPPVKTEPPAAAPKRGRRDSAGDQGTQIAKRPKSKVASKKP